MLRLLVRLLTLSSFRHKGLFLIARHVLGDVNGSKQRHSVYSKSLKFQPDSEDADPIPLTPAKVEEVKIEVIEKTETKPAEHVHKPTVKVTVPAGKSKAQLLHELEEDDSSSESSNDDSSDDDDTQPAPTKVAPLAPQRTHMHATAAKAAANKVREPTYVSPHII
jgi:hypothetical protein